MINSLKCGVLQLRLDLFLKQRALLILKLYRNHLLKFYGLCYAGGQTYMIIIVPAGLKIYRTVKHFGILCAYY